MDLRARAAKYYDLNPHLPKGVPFYDALIPSPNAHILELGCGTGRVLLPLTRSCGFIQGLDRSEAMVAICRSKLRSAQVPSTKARAGVGDITQFALSRTFHLIIAPFRVVQNLETDAQVDGLFRCIHNHLSHDGTCILNVFCPDREPETLRQEWCRKTEMLSWEVAVEDGRITCHERRPRLDPETLVLYPELIYRRYKGSVLTDETILQIPMRCYHPEAFERLIVDHGFRVLKRWGGYAGEAYGEGPELVVQFTT